MRIPNNLSALLLLSAVAFAQSRPRPTREILTPELSSKGFYNVVTDCGLPTDGKADSAAQIRACRLRHPGARFVWPKNRAYNDSGCDYRFSHSIVTAGDTGGATAEDHQGVNSGGMAENFPSVVRLCADVGVTLFDIPSSFGAGFAISDLHLYGNACWTSSNTSTFVLPFPWNESGPSADGIRAHARVKIERVTTECFQRHGINIDTDGYNGNANTTVVNTVLTRSNRGMGIFIRGGDTNAGRFTGISATFNQLDGINDSSFLGNYHAGHHTDGNGYDLSADGRQLQITNSVVISNLATMTAEAHGLVTGDYVRITGTANSRLNGRFFVLDVPAADRFVIYTPQQDRAAVVETASAFKLLGASANWHKALTACSINSGSVSLTCDSGGLWPSAQVAYPITIVGAGPAGADLVTFTTVNGSTSPCTTSTWAITANVLTVNCVNTFAVGQQVKLMGFDNDDLRDHEVKVATQSAKQITAVFRHADIALHANKARVFPPTVQLRDAASTSVRGVSGILMYRSSAFKSYYNAQLGGVWVAAYSEAGQNASVFSNTNLVLGGDHGADIDTAQLSSGSPQWLRGDSNGFHVSSGNILWDPGNRVAAVTMQFKPGKSFTTLLRFYGFNTMTKVWDEGFRIDAGLSWKLSNVAAGATRDAIDANMNGNLDLAPTLDSAEIRLNRGSTALRGTSVSFYNGSTSKVGSVDNTGLATFNGGVKAGLSGSTIYDSRELVQDAHSCGTESTCANTASGSNHIIFGSVALSAGTPSAATVTGISPAFTSTSSYYCTATPVGTTAAIAAAGIAVTNLSSSSFRFIGSNTVTTTVNYVCIGN